ncbi:hypothetical protein B0H66DRAFT_532840 [Apodospora peruviana]|uniref:Uncharacterized protein n=1 Tax=Apodospora peruviana TaxID=516989 RepID=A0AAE0I496_9PEZI|nr:hypothetical protein B0H66DRAFT_532840 [Apodospora peruviana]
MADSVHVGRLYGLQPVLAPQRSVFMSPGPTVYQNHHQRPLTIDAISDTIEAKHPCHSQRTFRTDGADQSDVDRKPLGLGIINGFDGSGGGRGPGGGGAHQRSFSSGYSSAMGDRQDSSTASPTTEPHKKKQKRNKPTLSCFECVERKTKVRVQIPIAVNLALVGT